MTGNDQTVTVSVKWKTQVFSDIQIDTAETPQVFKTQLWTLTGIPPERQTILGLKGGKLKDETDWSTTGLKQNIQLRLLGTPDSSHIQAPTAVPTVRDDLDLDAEESDATPIVVGPPGLVNLGNTCYMNATVQCLNAVPPLVSALRSYSGSTTVMNPAERVTAGLRDVISRLRSRNTPSINPANFLALLRQANPQFAERNNTGLYLQQDAEECWGEVLSRVSTSLKIDSEDGPNNHIDRLFGIRMRATDRCIEEGSSEVIERTENVRALKCHISQGVTQLARGISEGLEETIELNSEALDRVAQWKRTSRLDAIPPFLTVQFVRFFWKPAEQVKAKILKNVAFPVVLDVFDLCTEELQSKLSVKRDAAVAKSQAEVGTDTTVDAQPGESSMEESKEGSEVEAETGHYELCAVLTHQGRAADSGHYVAWVKDEGSKWYKFDDDKVSVHTEEDVKKLSGGGDWHMAYMCIYRAKNTV